MRVEIENECEEKLLQDAAKFGLSPSKYLSLIIRNIEIIVPAIEIRRESIEKVVVTMPAPRIETNALQNEIKNIPPRRNFVKNF